MAIGSAFGDAASGAAAGSSFGPWGTAIGGLAGGLYGMFGGGSNANAGKKYFQQAGNDISGIPGAVSPYLNPYMQAGQGAMSDLQNEYGQLTSNPGQFMNKIGQNFQQSPGYQFQVNQATNAANAAAAAGGMAGSPAEQVQLAGTVNGLANQDYYNWLNGAMGMFGQGLQGQQGMMGQGFNASQNMAEALAQARMAQANLAYNQGVNAQQGQAQDQGMFNFGLGSLASALGSYGSKFKGTDSNSNNDGWNGAGYSPSNPTGGN